MAESAFTKRVIADSLKELSRTKYFDKISVGEIAKNCNVNRQTFYYHFEDKYDLLKWIYYEDYYYPSLSDLTFDNWDKCAEKLLTLVKEDKAFSVNTIKHAGEEMIHVFLRDTEKIFQSLLDYFRSQADWGERLLRVVSKEEQNFITRFFAYGVCGIITSWVTDGMKEEPRDLAENMRVLLESCKQIAFNRVMDEKENKENDNK